MTFIRTHLSCPDCGSSDALSVNADGSSKCFSCGKFKKDCDVEIVIKPKVIVPSSIPASTFFGAIADRRISLSSCEKYGVKQDTEGNIYFPYNNDGEEVAYKKRTVDKKFPISGDWENAEPLFGMSRFNKGSAKSLTVVEGELDALAAYQMNGCKYPVVSVRNGAGSAVKDFKAAYEWLDSFETIVVCFDNDEAGRKASKEVCDVFGSKIKLMKLDAEYKDACDYLKDRAEHKFQQKFWQAEQHVPDGIVAGTSLWDLVNQPVKSADCFYPWKGLNNLTYGIRHGELVTLTAGSGLGKSQILREMVFHILNQTTDNIGLMFLEEGLKKTALSLMSLAANVPLHLPGNTIDGDTRRAAFDATIGSGRLYLFDNFGSTSIDNIISRIRYLAKGLGCKYIILDHISIILSAQTNGDERRAFDEIMTRLRMLVQETDIALIAVSHLKRPDGGKGHEEGAATSLAQLRGSASIAQLSDIVIGLERNGQADDIKLRNTTFVRVLKNRMSGLTGPATALFYNQGNGRIYEVEENEGEPL